MCNSQSSDVLFLLRSLRGRVVLLCNSESLDVLFLFVSVLAAFVILASVAILAQARVLGLGYCSEHLPSDVKLWDDCDVSKNVASAPRASRGSWVWRERQN